MTKNNGEKATAKRRAGRPKAVRPAGVAGSGRRAKGAGGMAGNNRGTATAKRRAGRPKEDVPKRVVDQICHWVAEGRTWSPRHSTLR